MSPSFLPSPYADLFDPCAPKLGYGRSAIALPLGKDHVLRFFHAGYHHFAPLQVMEEERKCIQFSADMKRNNPKLPIPELVAEGVFEPAFSLLDTPYHAWQIYQRMPGSSSSQFLSHQHSTATFVHSLSATLLAFHATAFQLFAPSNSFACLNTFMACPLGLNTNIIANSRFSAHQHAQAALREMTQDIEQLYYDIPASHFRILHGDTHPDNIHVASDGHLTGLFDPSPYHAPVELEFSMLSTFPVVMGEVVTAYDQASGIKLDRDLLYMASACRELGRAVGRGNPNCLRLAARHLDQLSHGNLPEKMKAKYASHANMLSV